MRYPRTHHLRNPAFSSFSFRRVCIAVDKNLKGELKIGALATGIRAWRRIPSGTSIANDRRAKEDGGDRMGDSAGGENAGERVVRVGRIAQADYTFSSVIKHGRSQRENNVSLITRLDSTRCSSPDLPLALAPPPLLHLLPTPLFRAVSLCGDITCRVLSGSRETLLKWGLKRCLRAEAKSITDFIFRIAPYYFSFYPRQPLRDICFLNFSSARARGKDTREGAGVRGIRVLRLHSRAVGLLPDD